ncbi:hypothetical protein B0H14DRAFT_3485223 [Mycena olivaceomarginata]|nr:hypothetical protein B0H14DRAFT_3485223 [Mycena olivaceomarginata]
MSAKKPRLPRQGYQEDYRARALQDRSLSPYMGRDGPSCESIVAHPEDARQGVSRPQIKKFVESKYKLTIGNAQNAQLSKALTTGTEKNIFVLPKGPSGRVKLAPKAKPANASAAKENKPTKAKPTKTATGKNPTAKSTTRTPAKKAATKGKPAKKTKPKAASTNTKSAKPAAKTPTKKLAGKATERAKKSMTTRAPAKNVVTGTTAASKAKSAKIKTVRKAAPVKAKAAAPAPKVPRKSPKKQG